MMILLSKLALVSITIQLTSVKCASIAYAKADEHIFNNDRKSSFFNNITDIIVRDEKKYATNLYKEYNTIKDIIVDESFYNRLADVAENYRCQHNEKYAELCKSINKVLVKARSNLTDDVVNSLYDKLVNKVHKYYENAICLKENIISSNYTVIKAKKLVNFENRRKNFIQIITGECNLKAIHIKDICASPKNIEYNLQNEFVDVRFIEIYLSMFDIEHQINNLLRALSENRNCVLSEKQIEIRPQIIITL